MLPFDILFLLPIGSILYPKAYGYSRTMDNASEEIQQARMAAEQDKKPQHSSFTNASVPLPLTFGIELEMLFLYDIDTLEAANCVAKEDCRGCTQDRIFVHPLDVVSKALQEAGTNIFDSSATLEEIEEAQYTRWTAAIDPTVVTSWSGFEHFMSIKPDKYEICTLELQSPKYVWDDGDGWRDDLRRTLQALNELFNNHKDDYYRLYLPDSTSLHVHIGVGTKREKYLLPLASVKSLLQLGTGFQRIVDELHTVPRFGSRAYFCEPISRFFKDMERENHLIPSGVVGWCQHMEQEIRSWDDDLLRNYKYDRNRAYNIANLKVVDGKLDSGPNTKGTIEFRQHRGTLEANEIIAWVEVTTNMIRFAHKIALTGDMVSIVRQHAMDLQMSFDRFLYMIDVPDQVVNYYDMWLNSTTHSKRVEQLEMTEMHDSRLTTLAPFFAHCREQQKNATEVMRAIAIQLKSGNYGLPEEVVYRLLQEKYPDISEAQSKYRW